MSINRTPHVTDLRKMPGHLIRRLNQISMAVFAERMAAGGFDLTSVQFAALTYIQTHPGTDQTSLARAIAYDKVTIGGVVDRLCHKGLVLREPSTTDRRARVLHLTDKGAETLARARPLVEDLQRDILKTLGDDEYAQIMALLDKATRDSAP